MGVNPSKAVTQTRLSTMPRIQVGSTYTLTATYPHDSSAFTQGLVYEGGRLFEGTGLWHGRSSVREVELETGKVLRKHTISPHEFGEGICLVDDSIFQLTWKSRRGYVYDRDTFELAKRFVFDTDTGQGWGLTYDNENLIVSDGSAKLYFWDPQTLKPVRELTVHEARNGVKKPIQKLNELEWIGGEILANVWFDDRIARIDPASGDVLGWLDMSGLHRRSGSEDVLNGIAVDPSSIPTDCHGAGPEGLAFDLRLLITGKLWSHLYDIRVPSRCFPGAPDKESI